MAHGDVLDAHGHGRLQAELAAALERADRAEVQLRTATDESSRLSDRIELLQHELADAKRNLAKSREETVAVTALAATHGARAVELDREATALRQKSYQLEMDISTLTAERDHLQLELMGMHVTIDDMTTARNQLANQLEDAIKQLARSSAAAAAAEDRYKAEMQQVQLRVAASEAEFRALHHAKGTLHEDLQRARGEVLALQAQLQDESRKREEQASECRRLQRELDATTQTLAQAQRLQRAAVTKSEELEEQLERLRFTHCALEADMKNAKDHVERQQEEFRLEAERIAELAGQVHGLTANLRHLEVENARLADSQAMMKVELEARAAEARAARGEAAELAADRARLLAEMQQKPVGAEDEVRRLRDALAVSRLEVTRLQKELAANDAVLADAESALVTLVSEKDGLQQALSVALMSERAALDIAEELKSQVAALAAQDVGELETIGRAMADQAEASVDANGVDQQRMISYLQSLPDTLAAGPSESGHERPGSATPVVVSSGPGSTASSMAAAAAAAASVRVVGSSAPTAVTARYPIQHDLSTTGSGSTLPSYRPDAINEAWEALSASGTDSSRKETGSGDGVAASTPTGVPSATSLVVASLSLAMGASGLAGDAAILPKGEVQLSTSSLSTTSVTSTSGNGIDAALAASTAKDRTPSSPRSATSTTLSGMQDEGVRITIAGMGDDTTASNSSWGNSKSSPKSAASGAAQAPAATNAISTTDVSSSVSQDDHLIPSLPHTNTSDLCEQDDMSSSEPSLGHGDKVRPQPSPGAQSIPVSAPAGSTQAATNMTPTLSRPPVSPSVLPDLALMPPREVYRKTLRASITLTPYQSLPPASIAYLSPSGAGSLAGSYTAAASSSPVHSGRTEASIPAASTSRERDVPASPRSSQPAVTPETSSMLQGSVYRSPTRVSLIAPRTGISGTGASEWNERPSVTSWQPVLGGTGAGNSSPMISPRVMLDARMLSRAVRPSADALSSALRASGIIPGIVTAGESGMAGSQQTPTSDSTMSRVPSVHPSPNPQQQQTNRPPPSPQQQASVVSRRPTAMGDAPQPEATTFPSPFASGNAAAVVASPRTSGTVGPPSPPSCIPTVTAAPPMAPATAGVAVSPPPPPSITSVEQLSRRISRQQQQQLSNSPSYTPRSSFSMASSRRTTLAQTAGLGALEAISAPVLTGDEQPQMRSPKRTTDKVSTPPVKEASPAAVYVNPALLPPAPSEEDVTLIKRLAAMDEALRAIGAI